MGFPLRLFLRNGHTNLTHHRAMAEITAGPMKVVPDIGVDMIVVTRTGENLSCSCFQLKLGSTSISLSVAATGGKRERDSTGRGIETIVERLNSGAAEIETALRKRFPTQTVETRKLLLGSRPLEKTSQGMVRCSFFRHSHNAFTQYQWALIEQSTP